MFDSQSSGLEPRDVNDVITPIVLGAFSAPDGFALSGRMALRAHGIFQRPTLDIDVTTNVFNPEIFTEAEDKVARALAAEGFEAQSGAHRGGHCGE